MLILYFTVLSVQCYLTNVPWFKNSLLLKVVAIIWAVLKMKLIDMLGAGFTNLQIGNRLISEKHNKVDGSNMRYLCTEEGLPMSREAHSELARLYLENKHHSNSETWEYKTV